MPPQPQTNPDDELERIVQQLMDEGKDEATIAAVIKQYDADAAPKAPPPKDTYKGPTDFWGGVKQSLTSGEALGAGLQGAKGWLKGATLDLPSSIISGLETIGGAIASPWETAKNLPSNISNAASNMWNTTQQAGSDPEAFGRMVGQVTGQPLTTAGVIRGAPSAIRAAGTPVAATGRVMQRYQPVSGLIPRIAEMRTMRNIERGIGSGIEAVGERMKQAFPPTVQGEIVPPEAPADFWEVPPAQPTALPPSNVHYPPPPPGSTPPPPAPPPGPIVGTPARPTPLGPERALPPAQSIQLPGNIAPTAPFGVEPQAPIIGNMNSPVTPHNIPPATPPAPVKPTPTAKPAGAGPTTEMILPKKLVSPQTLAHMKERGFELAGIDKNGDLIFKGVGTGPGPY